VKGPSPIGLRPAPKTGAKLVEGFSGAGWLVDGQAFPGVLIAASLAHPIEAATLEALDATLLQPLAALDPKPTLLLVGTGPAMRRPPPALLIAAKALGLAVEFMDSKAAARTYNVLILEARPVAALLLPA
jgi:uncharacterized protein